MTAARPIRRRQQKLGRTETGIKLSKAAVGGLMAAVQSRDNLKQQWEQSCAFVNELFVEVGLDANKHYFIEEDGSVFLEPEKS